MLDSMSVKESSSGFGIGAVVRLTGLSDHVIRAWERRHGVVKPGRDQAGTRRYTGADIERLNLLRNAVEAGHRIGAAASLSDKQIRAILPRPPRHESPAAVDEMLNAVRRFDRPQLEHVLAREALALGPLGLCLLAISPLLDRIGDGWACGEVCMAEEHMATAQIKSTLMSLLRFGCDRVGGDMMVFATLSGDRHEIGALMAAVCAQDAGARALYLGPDLPISEIVMAARRSAAKVVGISGAMPATKKHKADLSKLKSELPRGVGLWIGGRGWSKVQAPSGVRIVDTLEELRRQILRRSVRA